MAIDLHLSIPNKYKQKLEKLAALKGIGMSELVRRWIDKEYDSHIDAGKRLEEMLLLLQQDTTQHGLGNIHFKNNNKVQILQEDGSFKELYISPGPHKKKRFLKKH